MRRFRLDRVSQYAAHHLVVERMSDPAISVVPFRSTRRAILLLLATLAVVCDNVRFRIRRVADFNQYLTDTCTLATAAAPARTVQTGLSRRGPPQPGLGRGRPHRRRHPGLRLRARSRSGHQRPLRNQRHRHRPPRLDRRHHRTDGTTPPEINHAHHPEELLRGDTDPPDNQQE
jgi:hypothetical protein